MSEKSDPRRLIAWTPAKREEARHRSIADRLCRMGQFDEARAILKANNLDWPPYRRTPTDDPPTPREIANKRNAELAGAPTGEKPVTPLVQTPEQCEALVEDLSQRLLKGESAIKLSPQLGAASDEDKRRIMRLCGLTAEEFNQQLSDKLGAIADKALDRITDKLEKDQFKPNELSFLLAIAIDKRNNLEGRNQLHNANIAIQVNNYNGTKTKEEMIRSLRGETEPDSPPINIPP